MSESIRPNANKYPISSGGNAQVFIKIIETEKKIRMVSTFTAAVTQVTPNPHDHAGDWLEDIWDRGPHFLCCIDTHPSTPPFGVVPHTRKLDCSETEPGRDESRFNLISDDNRARVWKPLNPAFALQRQTAPIAGVMVWGTIAYNVLSPPVLIRGTVTAQRYVHDILQPHVLPLIQWLPGSIFQQDNARLPTAMMSQYCLSTFTTLPSPALSSDLSPIEHIWDHLGWRVGYPTNLNELEARLQQVWNEMSQDIIQNLYA
ncbi:transposable element Tcb2 transposase [Trichonephila clavipes]|nr:transposable element Tcb2 transposase [Trichonephila clavipes]